MEEDLADLRPVSSFGAKHGPDAPSRAKHIQWFGEAVIVNDASVDREDPHQEDDVTTSKHHVKHLHRHKKNCVLNMCTVGLNRGSFYHWITCLCLYLYLIITLLGEEATLSEDQVEGSTGHQHTVTHVTKHHRKQERESNDGVGSCNRQHTGCGHHTTMYKISVIISNDCWNLQAVRNFECFSNPGLFFHMLNLWHTTELYEWSWIYQLFKSLTR